MDNNALHRIRHSLAHVLAQAVVAMRPGSTLGFGPAIDDGCYYDFILSAPLSEADFPQLEERMREILAQDQAFEREELAPSDALARLEAMGEPYKRDFAQELLVQRGQKKLSFYRNGPFLDMCDGPHVERSSDIPADGFKLRSVAGAYWRGDERNAMMTRLYVWAFASKRDLEEHLARDQEARARDHKKLGPELGIYAMDSLIGRGLPLWLPHGTVIRDELEKLAKELEFRAGYQRVATPHLARVELYERSGHLPYYASHMYPLMELREADASESGAGSTERDDARVDPARAGRAKETYALRPMNCPHHHRVFAAQPRSYRDLPLRLAEYGQVYRFEDSGAVSGLLRVRGMCMNDAHIYCSKEQVRSELESVLAMYDEVFELLDIADASVRLSRWDPDDPKGREKYVDNPSAWHWAEQMLREVLQESGAEYRDGPGEAAFYGPKIDFQLGSASGREETLSTVQLDFVQPERLGLSYTGSDGRAHHPLCIHRAPLSTHERLVAFLIERSGGALPTWLAPEQVRVIGVSDRFEPYARQIVDRLRAQWVRAELTDGSETVANRVRVACEQKVPNLLVLGEREQAAGSVTLRQLGSRAQRTLGYDEFESALLAAIRGRSRAPVLDLS